MDGKRVSPGVRLSPHAVFAAERLAEMTGVPVAELLEIVLLELLASGTAVEASPPARRRNTRPSARPATVIPIGRARRHRSSPAGPVQEVRERSALARARGRAACQAAAQARQRSRELLNRVDEW
jgi:hypothetical protein